MAGVNSAVRISVGWDFLALAEGGFEGEVVVDEVGELRASLESLLS